MLLVTFYVANLARFNCFKNGESFFYRIIDINTLSGAYPKTLFFIFVEAEDGIAAQTGGISRIVAKNLKGSAVEAVQTVAAPQPNESFPVLNNTCDGVAGKAMTYAIAFKIVGLGLRGSRDQE